VHPVHPHSEQHRAAATPDDRQIRNAQASSHHRVPRTNVHSSR
jgi:hypothetical protein